jgi:hypothetical protein
MPDDAAISAAAACRPVGEPVEVQPGQWVIFGHDGEAVATVPRAAALAWLGRYDEAIAAIEALKITRANASARIMRDERWAQLDREKRLETLASGHVADIAWRNAG